MNKNNELGYFEYKKQKMQSTGFCGSEKFNSKFGFMLKLFIITFIVMFIVLVITIMKFSSRVDIEYSRGDSNYGAMDIDSPDDEQRKIDNRLLLIQQEENAPSEAKIISSEKNKNDVIDPALLEETRKIDRAQKLEEKKMSLVETTHQQSFERKNPLIQLRDEMLQESQKKQDIQKQEENITVVSKVVIGRYGTFDDAKEAMLDIKSRVSGDFTPFVRKLGDVYGIQMGSYRDFAVARSVAQGLKVKGYDVWIYQQ